MVSYILEAPLTGGCLEAWPAAYPSLMVPDVHEVSRLSKPVHSKNIPLSLIWQLSNIARPEISHSSEPARQKQQKLNSSILPNRGGERILVTNNWSRAILVELKLCTAIWQQQYEKHYERHLLVPKYIQLFGEMAHGRQTHQYEPL